MQTKKLASNDLLDARFKFLLTQAEQSSKLRHSYWRRHPISSRRKESSGSANTRRKASSQKFVAGGRNIPRKLASKGQFSTDTIRHILGHAKVDAKSHEVLEKKELKHTRAPSRTSASNKHSEKHTAHTSTTSEKGNAAKTSDTAKKKKVGAATQRRRKYGNVSEESVEEFTEFERVDATARPAVSKNVGGRKHRSHRRRRRRPFEEEGTQESVPAEERAEDNMKDTKDPDDGTTTNTQFADVKKEPGSDHPSVSEKRKAPTEIKPLTVSPVQLKEELTEESVEKAERIAHPSPKGDSDSQKRGMGAPSISKIAGISEQQENVAQSETQRTEDAGRSETEQGSIFFYDAPHNQIFKPKSERKFRRSIRADVVGGDEMGSHYLWYDVDYTRFIELNISFSEINHWLLSKQNEKTR